MQTPDFFYFGLTRYFNILWLKRKATETRMSFFFMPNFGPSGNLLQFFADWTSSQQYSPSDRNCSQRLFFGKHGFKHTRSDAHFLKLIHLGSCSPPQQCELQPRSSVPEQLSVKCATRVCQVCGVTYQRRAVLLCPRALCFQDCFKRMCTRKEHELPVTTRHSWCQDPGILSSTLSCPLWLRFKLSKSQNFCPWKH